MNPTSPRLHVPIAAFVVLILGAAFWCVPRLSATPFRALVDRWEGAETFETGIGQNSSFVLRDGSSIELNAQSRVRVAFNGRERAVDLVEGQALFEVAEEARRPFVVRAGDRRILALGTRFDVRLDPRTVQVTLIEGAVRVDHGQVEEARLTPGMQLLATTDAGRGTRGPVGATVRSIDVTRVTAWRNGHVFLDDLTLDAAVAEMNKHSPVQIRLGDRSLSTLRIKGMFRAGQQDAFVAALEQSFPIVAVRHRDREIVVSARRQA